MFVCGCMSRECSHLSASTAFGPCEWWMAKRSLITVRIHVNSWQDERAVLCPSFCFSSSSSSASSPFYPLPAASPLIMASAVKRAWPTPPLQIYFSPTHTSNLTFFQLHYLNKWCSKYILTDGGNKLRKCSLVDPSDLEDTADGPLGMAPGSTPRPLIGRGWSGHFIHVMCLRCCQGATRWTATVWLNSGTTPRLSLTISQWSCHPPCGKQIICVRAPVVSLNI